MQLARIVLLGGGKWKGKEEEKSKSEVNKVNILLLQYKDSNNRNCRIVIIIVLRLNPVPKGKLYAVICRLGDTTTLLTATERCLLEQSTILRLAS